MSSAARVTSCDDQFGCAGVVSAAAPGIRLRCDLCSGEGNNFLACSARCLRRHVQETHGAHAPETYVDRARVRIQGQNAQNQLNRTDFAGHRAQLMKLLMARPSGGSLCLLGAGNCDDVDLPALLEAFDRVHLCDFDLDALERAREGVPSNMRDRLVVHGGVDLTGVLAEAEDWATDAALFARGARDADVRIIESIGGPFDVVVSSAVMSQLCTPLFDLLACEPERWLAIMEAVARIHLRTLLGLTRPGGRALLCGDVVFAPRKAALVDEAPTWATLPAEVEDRLRSGFLALRNPEFLLRLLNDAEFAKTTTRPTLTQPWLWTVGDSVMLVYGILLHKRAAPSPRQPAPSQRVSQLLSEPYVAKQLWNNRESSSYGDLYRPHRERLTELVLSGGTGGRLCVLGAGNCNALDLAALAASFAEVHLVDIDHEAMLAVVGRQLESVRARITLHAPVDLSGVLHALREWREAAPEMEEIAQSAARVPQELVTLLSAPYDCIVSDCLLTQVYWTCYEALGSGKTLGQLVPLLLAAHLQLMSGLSANGATCVLATDCAHLAAEQQAHQNLTALIAKLEQSGSLFTGTAPGSVLECLSTTLRARVRDVRLTSPWLWRLSEERTVLTYAVCWTSSR